ncbi:MAG: hypothetical protein PHH98_00675 [Candidatus Gracilibacteria bacterium]|nr:hypothetical protein [Candidatus Gracilibacteria bacterium]
MYLKINTSINYMFDGSKFVIFFHTNNIEIKNKVFAKAISIFFVNNFKKVFIKLDFVNTFNNEKILDQEGVESIYDLFIKNDIFINQKEFYKELLYISKKWYNPYNISLKLDYKYSDIPYYYDNGFLSKDLVDLDNLEYKNLKYRRSFRTEYIYKENDITNDLLKLLRISYGNIDYREHRHVCNGSKISTIHKTVPSAGGFYNIVLFSILDNGNLYYFNGKDNILISSSLNYLDILGKILTKSAIWADNDSKGAIQFLNIDNTKGVVIAFGLIDKIYKKYYNKSLPFLLLEAGHIYQNLSLFSNDFNIGTLEIGSVVEENISNLIANNINNDFIKSLFEDKKLLYLNTMFIGYIKE